MSGVQLRRTLTSPIQRWHLLFHNPEQSTSAIVVTGAAISQRRTFLEARDVLPTRKPRLIPRGIRLGLEPKPALVVLPPAKPPPKAVMLRLTKTHIETLDPTGTKSKLISRKNKEGIKPGDILQIRFTPDTQREPFSGVLMELRRRGTDTGLLLRNQLTRVGVEMWIKLYSPTVEGVDIIQRAAKRARRARLTYLRKPKHDIGSVQNIVTQYTRQMALLRSGGAKKEAERGIGGAPRGTKK